MHRTLEQVLRLLLKGNDSKWAEYLPYTEMFMNSTPNASTQRSPHEIVFGKPALNPFVSLSNVQELPAVADFAAERQAIWNKVAAAMQTAKQEQKRYAD